MPTKMEEGEYTVKEVIQNTYHYMKNRLDYAKRDKILNRVRIRKVKFFEKDRRDMPLVKYEVTTTSTPQYKPYTTGIRKPTIVNRKVKHSYDIVFETDELSLNTKRWKVALGSGKKWVKPPQSKVRSIYSETRKKWTPEKIKKHKENKSLYLDAGDYNSQVNGINGDWLFRCANLYKEKGHLFGRLYNEAAYRPANKMNPKKIMFFPKHLLSFFRLLMEKGILKDK